MGSNYAAAVQLAQASGRGVRGKPMTFREHEHDMIHVPHPSDPERPWTCRTCGAYFEYKNPELYTRECAWCDDTFSCNRAHEKDMRPAYCLCIPCATEHSRVYREKHGEVEPVTPEEYDPPTYWPFPEADSA